MPHASKYVQGLNPPQADAVRHVHGPMLVLAGAGTGKTRVITRRIAYLIAERHAAPSEILAVTFTNKAADEMRERVADLVGKECAAEIVVSTFHSFCVRVLREHAEHIGYRRNFTISTEGDSRTLLRRVIEDVDRGDSFSLGTFQSAISLHKNAGTEPGRPKTLPKPKAKLKASETEEKYKDHLPDVFERYQSALRAANSVDFDDLLLFTLRLWREHPRVLAEYQKRFQFVLVDEYQDTNHVQYELLRLLVAKHRNLCVVGDDDQSIYGWRGADVKHLLEFERDFADAKIVTLDQNYRSTSTILNAANSVIANNTKRREKRLWSQLGEGRPIDYLITGDEEEEARQAVQWLQHIQTRVPAKYSDFAVLYRSNVQSRPFEIAFRHAGIPYVVVGGQDFFERAEVKDVISYLKVIVNPNDEPAFLRVVNTPRRGIGDTTLHRIHDLCREEKLNLGRAIAEALKRDIAPPQAREGLSQFLGLVQHFRQLFRERPGSLRDAAKALIEATGYYEELERAAKNRDQAMNRRQNIDYVFESLAEYEARAPQPTLAGFLDESSLTSDFDRLGRDDKRKTGVTLMTIHSAKGLEFPFVFIVGVEDGLLPHERSLNENTLDEERRLFYVALTRAQRHATLFEAVSRARNGRPRMTTTSRFLHEIPEALLRKHVLAVRDIVQEHVAPPKPKAKRRPKPHAPKKRP